MSLEVLADLVFRCRDETEAQLVAEHSGHGTHREREAVPKRIQDARVAAERVEALAAPREVILFFLCRIEQARADLWIARDERSRAVVVQMHADEARHGTKALEAGGVDFPAPVKDLMTIVSRLMTETSYRI